MMGVVERGTLRKSATPVQIWRGCHPGRAELCSPALSSGGHGGAWYMNGREFFLRVLYIYEESPEKLSKEL